MRSSNDDSVALSVRALNVLDMLEKSAFIPMPGGQMPPPPQDPSAMPPPPGGQPGMPPMPPQGMDPAAMQQMPPMPPQGMDPAAMQQMPPMPPPQGDGAPPPEGGNPLAMLQEMVRAMVIQTLTELGISGKDQGQDEQTVRDAEADKADRETTKAKVRRIEENLSLLMSAVGVQGAADSEPADAQGKGFGMGAGIGAPLDQNTMQGMDDVLPKQAEATTDSVTIGQHKKFAKLRQRRANGLSTDRR